MAGLLKAILFFCIFYCIAAKSLPQNCGSENFIKPHKALCDRYFICNDGKLELEKCPEGKLFNDLTLQCEDKDCVDCGKRRIPGEPKKNRFLEDLVDLYYLKAVLDVIDIAVVDSKIVIIDNDMDF